MIPYLACRKEYDLIVEIDKICYGEILDVVAFDDPKDQRLLTGDKQINFLKALRREGKLDRVIIHDGEPTAAEVREITNSGLQCIRKLKF
jgi:hypothetical protein